MSIIGNHRIEEDSLDQGILPNLQNVEFSYDLNNVKNSFRDFY